VIFIFNIHQRFPKSNILKLHILCKRRSSACSVCILPPCTRRTACGEMRNGFGHVVWRHGQSPSHRTFHSAFYFPHSACRSSAFYP